MKQEQIELEDIKKELFKLKRDVEELKSLKEDFEFARRIDEAWKDYERGEFIEINKEDLSRELKKW